MKDGRYSWTQPCCEQCWDQINPGRVPIQIKEEFAEMEICVHCANQTRAGIYVRIDPASALHPTLEKD